MYLSDLYVSAMSASACKLLFNKLYTCLNKHLFDMWS